MAQQLRAGMAHIFSRDPPISVIALMDDSAPSVDSGYGGWEEVARPRRSPITTYKGAPGLHLTFGLMLDSFIAATTGKGPNTVERDTRALMRMAEPTGANGEPPRVRIAAPGTTLPYQGRWWVIDSLAWGDARAGFDGRRVRQQVTVGLLEYVEDVHLKEQSAANRRRSQSQKTKKKRGSSTKRTVSRTASGKKKKTVVGLGPSAMAEAEFGSGESLVAIAARELGDASRWVEIAELSGLRDPRAITPGAVIRLP